MKTRSKQLTLAGLVLLPLMSSPVLANEDSLKVLIGAKSLDAQWGENDSMDSIGIMYTLQPTSLPIGIAVDFFGSGNEKEISGITTETTVGELNLGLRWQRLTSQLGFSPYFGAGISLMSAELQEVRSGRKHTEEDTGLGYWVGAGMDYHFTPQWSVGLDAHLSSADVTLSGQEMDAGGFNWGATLGYRF